MYKVPPIWQQLHKWVQALEDIQELIHKHQDHLHLDEVVLQRLRPFTPAALLQNCAYSDYTIRKRMLQIFQSPDALLQAVS